MFDKRRDRDPLPALSISFISHKKIYRIITQRALKDFQLAIHHTYNMENFPVVFTAVSKIPCRTRERRVKARKGSGISGFMKAEKKVSRNKQTSFSFASL